MQKRRVQVTRLLAGVGAGEQVILAVLAGQSNMNGRNFVSGDPSATTANPADPNPGQSYIDPDIFQYVCAPGQGDYQTITSAIVEPDHKEDIQRVGPDLNILYGIKAANPGAKVIAVPCAQGSSGILNGGWLSDSTPGSGGVHYEDMIDRATEAHAAALVAYPGANISVQLYWVQGEQDGSEARDGALYKAALQDVFTRFRSRVPDAANCPIIIGSMVPRKFTPGVAAGYVASYVPINEAQVDLSVDMENVHYVLGPDQLLSPSNTALEIEPAGATQDGLHYQPHNFAREFGSRMGSVLSDSTGPSVTNAASQGSIQGNEIALALTHDSPDGHATFEITGGADQALFEISNRYINPTLRWVGDGTGPAVGSYAVEVTARDGAGNTGIPRAFTWTVAQPYGVGDQGPITLQSTYIEEAYAATTGGYSRAIPVKKGMNVFAFISTAGFNRDTSFAVTVDGANAFKIGGTPAGGNVQIWGFISAVDIDAEVAVSYTGSGGTHHIQAAALTGTKAAPMSVVASDLTAWANGSSPYTGASKTVPADGLLMMFAAANTGPFTPTTGTTQVASGGGTNNVALFSRTTTGAAEYTAPGGYSGRATIVFEKSV